MFPFDCCRWLCSTPERVAHVSLPWRVRAINAMMCTPPRFLPFGGCSGVYCRSSPPAQWGSGPGMPPSVLSRRPPLFAFIPCFVLDIFFFLIRPFTINLLSATTGLNGDLVSSLVTGYDVGKHDKLAMKRFSVAFSRKTSEEEKNMPMETTFVFTRTITRFRVQ